MTNLNISYDQLLEDKAEILGKIVEEVSKHNPDLAADFRAVVRLLNKYGSNGEKPNIQLPNKKERSLYINKSHVQIVRMFFKDNPEKEFSPGMIRDSLIPLIEQGIIKSETEEVIRIAHRALRSLRDQEFIDKIEREGEYPVYKLKKKEKGLI